MLWVLHFWLYIAEEKPEANGEQMVPEATNNAMLGNGIDELHREMKFRICRDERKVSWQDSVALSV